MPVEAIGWRSPGKVPVVVPLGVRITPPERALCAPHGAPTSRRECVIVVAFRRNRVRWWLGLCYAAFAVSSLGFLIIALAQANTLGGAVAVVFSLCAVAVTVRLT